MGAYQTLTATGSRGHHTFTLTISEGTPNISLNSSPITFVLTASSSSYNFDYNSKSITYTVYINGTAYTYSNGHYPKYSSWTVASGTVNIDHDDDGGKILSFGFSVSDGIGQSYTTGNCSNSSTVGLTTIARKSSASTRYTQLSSSDKAGIIYVDIARASSSFTHTVVISCNGHSYTETGCTTLCYYYVPISWLSNTYSATVYATVYTYNGSTLIGSASASTTTATLRSSIQPSVSFSVSRIQGDVPTSWGDIYVRTKSKYSLTISGTAGYGSSISSYIVNGSTISTNNTGYAIDSGYLTTAGTNTITVTVKDARGGTSTVKKTIDVIDYYPPAFSSVLTQRTDKTGVQVGSGSYFKSVYSTKYASCNRNNTIKITMSYIKHDKNQQYVNVSNVSGVAHGGDLLGDASYTVRYGITDYFTTSPVYYYDDISTEAFTMYFKKGGNAIALGKASEDDNTFDVNFFSVFRKAVTLLDGILTLKAKGVTSTIGSLNSDFLHIHTDAPFGVHIGNKLQTYNDLTVGRNDGTNTQYGIIKQQSYGVTNTFGSLNSGFCHYFTDASSGHYFNKDVRVSGMVYCGKNYDQVVALRGDTVYCYAGNEVDFYSSSTTMWFGYRNGGNQGTNYYCFGAGNGSSSRGTISCLSVVQTSDRKAKKDIKEISKAKEIIMGIKPVEFSFKNGDSKGKRKHMGVIAQELSEHLKSIDSDYLSVVSADIPVKKDDGGMDLKYFKEGISDENLSWSVSYTELIAPLIKVVQDQQKQIDELQKQIDEIRGNSNES